MTLTRMKGLWLRERNIFQKFQLQGNCKRSFALLDVLNAINFIANPVQYEQMEIFVQIYSSL